MIVADLLGWWYLRGWAWAVRYFFVLRTHRILNYFSISDLLKTLFSPFRQDSLQLQHAPIGVKLQALGGNIISRIFGAIIRSILIFSGIILLLCNASIGLVASIIWPLLPISPLLALILLLTGIGA